MRMVPTQDLNSFLGIIPYLQLVEVFTGFFHKYLLKKDTRIKFNIFFSFYYCVNFNIIKTYIFFKIWELIDTVDKQLKFDKEQLKFSSNFNMIRTMKHNYYYTTNVPLSLLYFSF